MLQTLECKVGEKYPSKIPIADMKLGSKTDVSVTMDIDKWIKDSYWHWHH
jgi:hypothetical protein